MPYLLFQGNPAISCEAIDLNVKFRSTFKLVGIVTESGQLFTIFNKVIELFATKINLHNPAKRFVEIRQFIMGDLLPSGTEKID